MKWYDPIFFLIQVPIQMAIKLFFALAGLFIIPVALTKTRFPDKHPFRDYVQRQHEQRYIAEGASGNWIYERLPEWPIIKPFDNLNYGLRGEHNGRWSALVNGKEAKPWYKFRQAAIRNPANGLRYWDLTSCQVDNCDISWWGDKGPLQVNGGLVEGWNFVKGVDRDTKRKYYSFQLVHGWGKKKTHALRLRFGFKVEPSHIDRGDLPPRKERATFTFRINPYKSVELFD